MILLNTHVIRWCIGDDIIKYLCNSMLYCDDIIKYSCNSMLYGDDIIKYSCNSMVYGDDICIGDDIINFKIIIIIPIVYAGDYI